MNESQFRARQCPFCSSDRNRVVLALRADHIFAANWSYRPQRLPSLQLKGDETFPISRCVQCGFVFASRLPDDAFLAVVYDEVIDAEAARVHSFTVESMAARMRYLARMLPLLKPINNAQAVLDFGCGFGPSLTLLAANSYVSAFGFDTSEMRVNELRAKGLRASVDMGEVRQFAPFAGVILDNVLEHMPDPRTTLGLIRSLCVDGAIAFVSVPNASDSSLRRQALAHGRGAPCSMEINPWEHLNYFDQWHLDRMMHDAGFDRLPASKLPGEVEIGLRPESRALARWKNVAASLLRLARYAVVGDSTPSTNASFYRVRGIGSS